MGTLLACVCVHHIRAREGPKRALESKEPVFLGYELPCEGLALNLGPLQGQLAPLTI